MKKSSIYIFLLICFLACFKVPAYAVKFTCTAFSHTIFRGKTSGIAIKLNPQYVDGNLQVFVHASADAWQTDDNSSHPLVLHQSFLESQNLHFSYQFQQGGIEGNQLVYSYYNLQNMTVTQITYQIPGNLYLYGPYLLQWYMDMPASWTPDSNGYHVVDPLQGDILSSNFELLSSSIPDGIGINDGKYNGQTTLRYFHARLRGTNDRSGSALVVIPASGLQGSQWQGFKLGYCATGERNDRTINISASIEVPPSLSTFPYNVSYSSRVSEVTNAHFINNINWEEQTASGNPQLQQLQVMQRLEFDWRHILALIFVLAVGKYFFNFCLF